MDNHDNDASMYSHVHTKKAGSTTSSSKTAQLEKIRLMSDILSTRQMMQGESPAPPGPSHPDPHNARPEQAYKPLPAAWQELKGAAKAAQPAALSHAQAQRDREARMLREMFQAVWPDLGSFKSWAGATRVASMSGSLTLSVAFFGFVWYMSTTYDKAVQSPTQSQASSSSSSSPPIGS